MPPSKTNIAAAFEKIGAPWTPHLAGRVNETAIKLARLQGEFIWHQHDHEDEMFLVIEGEMTMRFRDGEVHLTAGEMIVVPRGVEHLPVSGPHGASVMLVEPASTLNTGNVRNERTVEALPEV